MALAQSERDWYKIPIGYDYFVGVGGPNGGTASNIVSAPEGTVFQFEGDMATQGLEGFPNTFLKQGRSFFPIFPGAQGYKEPVKVYGDVRAVNMVGGIRPLDFAIRPTQTLEQSQQAYQQSLGQSSPAPSTPSPAPPPQTPTQFAQVSNTGVITYKGQTIQPGDPNYYQTLVSGGFNPQEATTLAQRYGSPVARETTQGKLLRPSEYEQIVSQYRIGPSNFDQYFTRIRNSQTGLDDIYLKPDAPVTGILPAEPRTIDASTFVTAATQPPLTSQGRLLGPTEYEQLRIQNRVDASNFDQFFRRDERGNIYLKPDAPLRQPGAPTVPTGETGQDLPGQPSTTPSTPVSPLGRLLTPSEYEKLRQQYGVAPENFDQYFTRDAQGNIYLKSNLPPPPGGQPGQPGPGQPPTPASGQLPTGARLLTPSEFTALRNTYNVGPDEFDQFFIRDAQGNIYLKPDARVDTDLGFGQPPTPGEGGLQVPGGLPIPSFGQQPSLTDRFNQILDVLSGPTSYYERIKNLRAEQLGPIEQELIENGKRIETAIQGIAERKGIVKENLQQFFTTASAVARIQSVETQPIRDLIDILDVQRKNILDRLSLRKDAVGELADAMKRDDELRLTALKLAMDAEQDVYGQMKDYISIVKDLQELQEGQNPEKALVAKLIERYPDAGIATADSLATAQQKLPRSSLYRQATRLASGAGGAGGLTTTPMTSKQLDQLLVNYPQAFKAYIKSIASTATFTLNTASIGKLYQQFSDYGPPGGSKLPKWQQEQAVWRWLASQEAQSLSDDEKKQEIQSNGFDPYDFGIY